MFCGDFDDQFQTITNLGSERVRVANQKSSWLIAVVASTCFPKRLGATSVCGLPHKVFAKTVFQQAHTVPISRVYDHPVRIDFFGCGDLLQSPANNIDCVPTPRKR